MHRPTRLNMKDLNPHLMCVLCDGYYVDATTVVECLHSFCRACIVKHLETSKFCPICDVQVHKTKPLMSLRSDQTLQDIVYKLVPSLYPNEMKRRRSFYSDHPEKAARCDSEERGEATNQRFIYTPEETISLSLEYGVGVESSKVNSRVKEETSCIGGEKEAPRIRYLLCPAAITVGHLRKFLVAKYNVPPTFRVEILYLGDVLNETYTLMDIAYIYAWRRSGPMRFFYQINKRLAKRRMPPAAALNADVATGPIESDAKPKKVPVLSALPLTTSEERTCTAQQHEAEEKIDIRGNKAYTKELKPMPALSSTVPTQSSACTTQVTASHKSCSSVPPSITGELAAKESLPTCVRELISKPVTSTVEGTAPMLTMPVLGPNRTPVAPSSVLPVAQPIISPSFIASLTLPQENRKSKRSKSRVKNRSVHRPLLAKLAPYPPSCTSSPVSTLVTAAMQNHFNSSQVSCFAAPPVTCLSTPPVLGTMSVSYLSSPAVNCYGPAATVNGTSGFKGNNLIPTAVTASVPTCVTVVPVTNHVSQAIPPVTQGFCPRKPNVTSAVNVVATTCVQSSTSNNLSCSTPSHTKGSITIPSTVPNYSLGTGHVNASKGVTQPLSTLPPNVQKSVVSASGTTPVPSKSTLNLATTVSQAQNTVTASTAAPSITVTSPFCVSSLVSVPVSSPVISTNSTKQNEFSSTKSPTPPNRPATVSGNNPSPLASMAFSVQNLIVPNITNRPSPSINAPVSTSSEIKLQPATTKLPEPMLRPSTPVAKENITELTCNVEEQSKSADVTSSSHKDVMVTSPVSTEKSAAINVPFKEVKSSITAEFSDNDDLGCQPDLVVDEQKLDNSDNEYDADDDALRRKITAIAEKEDEVDIETDSGRASDVSNQARSSGDDDIGSPMPTTTTPEVEKSVAPIINSVPSISSSVAATSVVAPSPLTSKPEDNTPHPKINGIDRIINNLHRNHERKDTIGALDLSTSFRKSEQGDSTRPRARPVANPPVLDIKHRQQTCLPAPTKQHTACVPAPKHPTSSNFLISPLSTTVRHTLMPVPATPKIGKTKILSPLTVPHFNPSPLMGTTALTKSPPVPVPNPSHIMCRTPPMPNSNSYRSQPSKRAASSPRQNKTSPTSYQRKSSDTSSFTLEPSSSPRFANSLSPTAPLRFQRLSPSTTVLSSPTKAVDRPSSEAHLKMMSPPVPSTSSYKLSTQPYPIFKKSDKNSHHGKFKSSSNLTVINHDPNGYGQRIVIKKVVDPPRSNSYGNHHHRS